MDQLFVNLVGKPRMNLGGKIITLVAENFSMQEDHAKFLKATFAIPTEKQLSANQVMRLVQVGPLHSDIRDQLEKAGWSIVQCDDQMSSAAGLESLCKKLDDEMADTRDRAFIYINDASRIQLSCKDSRDWKKFLWLIHKWRCFSRHFVVVLYQQSQPVCPQTARCLRDLEYISDGCLTTKSFKRCYLQSMWFRAVDRPVKTLIPPKIETHYYTCKIGKSYWSQDLLCFYEKNRVAKDYDPDSNGALDNLAPVERTLESKNNLDRPQNDNAFESALHRVGLTNDDEDHDDTHTATLPYIKAQNPEQSKIFYYPDKDDDVDEDDPDDDLGI